MNKRPAYVGKLEDYLKTSLEGTILPPEGQLILGDFVVKTQVRISQVMEDLTRTLIMRHARGASVNFEPHGKDTFPDIQVSFNKETSSFLEVKTMNKTATTNLQVASLGNFVKALGENNRIYLDTYWIIWTWRTCPSGSMIESVEVKSMLELAGRDKDGGLAVELRSGSRNYIYRKNNTFNTEEELIRGCLKTIKNLNIKADERREHVNTIETFLSKNY